MSQHGENKLNGKGIITIADINDDVPVDPHALFYNAVGYEPKVVRYKYDYKNDTVRQSV